MGKERCKGFTISYTVLEECSSEADFSTKKWSVSFLWCVCCVRYVEKVFDFVGRALGLSLLRSAHHPTIIRLRLNKVKVIIEQLLLLLNLLENSAKKMTHTICFALLVAFCH